MNDDSLRESSTREIFEAIVAQLEDPEVGRRRRTMLLVGAAVFVVAVVVTIGGGLGWQILLAFSSTFIPGLIVAVRISGRRFAGSGGPLGPFGLLRSSHGSRSVSARSVRRPQDRG